MTIARLNVIAALERRLRYVPGVLFTVNENGCWLTFSVVTAGDGKCIVHAAFPAGAKITAQDGLVLVDAVVPMDLDLDNLQRRKSP